MDTKVIFLRRYLDGIKEVASVIYPDIWSGSTAIKDMVYRTHNKLFSGYVFDPNNVQHYKVLPIVYSGCRFWAVIE